MRVPYALSDHGEEEIAAVVEVLRGSTLAGPKVREFESNIAAVFGKKRAVMVNSGSSALLLGVAALDLPSGAEVVTPPLTFSTTVASIVQNGLVPAFVDVEASTLNIDVNRIEAMIGPFTKAMVIPNLMGNIPDWDTLRALADKYDLCLLEDSADTLDCKLRGTPTGTRSDISITSFYGAHIINCAGNGGMLMMDDQAYEAKVRTLRSWGRRSAVINESESIESRFNVTLGDVSYDAKYVFDSIGYNMEPSEVGAAFGIEQFKKLSHFARARRKAFDAHLAFFREYEEFFILPREMPESEVIWYAFPIILRDGVSFTRTEMQIYLEERDIQTRPVFTGNILCQPGFQNIERRVDPNGYPETDLVMRNGLVVGCHQALSSAQIGHVHETCAAFLKQNS